ncbi:hypothetical protein [Collimonas humicola]|uniref:hypothetical protein n=1 Tax=Collimonas humicola TaxID=2825886 RepID=UPI001B8C633C|nr:hypothetical protein [Collimonas humicola]
MSAVSATIAPRTRRRSKSSLAIVERAFRGSLEEQYGHIVWLSRVMRRMGANTGLLLKGDAVMFGRCRQERVALSLGDLRIDDISHYETTLQHLLQDGVPVYAWQADCERLQLMPENLMKQIRLVQDDDMPGLIQQYDCVWYW